ncbi:MAG: hypothetical protein K2R93_02190 [Gemmatimonadaceae bacterium]|nr:hypothetical protein [Gemmatimonadaceae bacterium]
MPRSAAAAPTISVAPAARAVSDTAFKAEGNYTLTLTVDGQAMTMALVVEKKADGTFSGVFRNAELGDIPSTSFKLEGRTMTIGVQTPGGPAGVTLTVKPDNTVEGEWGMAGDGSKISGKKES